MTALSLYTGVNQNVLEFRGLRNSTDAAGVYLNNATLQVTLLDSAGQEVSGQSWPAPMAYVSGSNGNYRVTFENTLVLEARRKYKAKVEITAATSETAEILADCVAETRRS